MTAGIDGVEEIAHLCDAGPGRGARESGPSVRTDALDRGQPLETIAGTVLTSPGVTTTVGDIDTLPTRADVERLLLDVPDRPGRIEGTDVRVDAIARAIPTVRP